jgi:5-methyltetrahydrofolate--homocysteine methyltransferase
MADYKNLMDAVMTGNAQLVSTLVQQYLDDGNEATQILNLGLIAAMDVVGERMENEDMFIPEVLMAAMTMGKGVEILKPFLKENETTAAGRVVIGTVKGDLHDIGKNLVAMMIESGGLEVHNLGVDISPEDFVKSVQEKNANIVCLSALLTTTMPMMKKTIDAIAASGLRDQVKVMVGGAPVTQAFADEIGADGFAADAGAAVKMAKAFVA